jgi:biopolymer transport protein ExbB
MRVALLTIFLSALLFSAEKSDLELAYEKEFAFLELQKKELQKRLKEIKKSNSSKIWLANRDIKKLQDTYISRKGEAEGISETLYKITQETEALSLNRDILSNTLLQSESTLEKYREGFAHNSNLKVSEQLQSAFETGEKTILDLQSIREEKGMFFLTDGKSVEGTIIKIGNIASYGISATSKGMLAPAGGERLKIWSVPAGDVANKIHTGAKVDTLDIFLYESLVKEISERKEKSVLDIINSGGLIGWVIVGLGLFAMIVIVIRTFFLQIAGGNINKLYSTIENDIENGRVQDALDKSEHAKSSIANVMKATLRNIDRDRQHLDDIISEAIIHESGKLDRFHTVIMVVAAIAPLLGLLGTVTGMITTFDLITEFGTGDPKMLSGGISEALVTTELGLIVAIPALVFGNLLSSLSERIKDSMEQTALKVSNLYSIYLEESEKNSNRA